MVRGKQKWALIVSSSKVGWIVIYQWALSVGLSHKWRGNIGLLEKDTQSQTAETDTCDKDLGFALVPAELWNRCWFWVRMVKD